jgi:hypothetical protein
LADHPPPGIGDILTYHIPSTMPAFQARARNANASATAAALSRIPTPEPVQLALEQVEE